MTLIAWDARFELGVPKMDSTHQEFVQMLNALGNASDDDLLRAFDALGAHTVEHFGQEDRWMAESGFGAMCHPSEHMNVLEVFRLVRERLLGGDFPLARKLARELVPWFENHAATMDTILVGHMAHVGYDPDNPQAFVAAAAQAEAAATGHGSPCDHGDGSACVHEHPSACGGLS